jgi:hypothetical protein
MLTLVPFETTTSTGRRETPSQPISSKKMPIVELRVLNTLVYKMSTEKFWRGGPKNSAPPLSPPPPIGPIHITLDSSQRQDSEYLVLIWFDTWRPKIRRTAPSPAGLGTKVAFFSLINVGSGFHRLRSFSFLSLNLVTV